MMRTASPADHADTPRDQSRWARASLLLANSRLARRPFGALPDELRPGDEAEAYALQDHVHMRMTEAGRGRRVGWKIGCTTKVMQAYLAIPNPCSGGVYETGIASGEGHYKAEEHQRVGVECEIAVRLRSDLLPDEAGQITHRTAVAAIGSCMAAIEVVEDRYVDYRSLDTPTLIADDFFNLGCVLGSETTDFPPLALDTVSARMEINGTERGRGTGMDILGHPLEALCWLAMAAARRGEPLRAGEFVLLGSLVQTNWLEKGDKVRIFNEPFGEVALHFD